MKMRIEEASIDGFHSNLDGDWGYFKFVALCTLYGTPFRTDLEVYIDQPLFTLPLQIFG